MTPRTSTDRTVPTDIRAYMTADEILQKEINQALEDLADTLSEDGDRRLASLLVKTLEPSWSAHVSFQEYVLFPIVERRKSATPATIQRLKADHAALTERHAEVRDGLEVFDGRSAYAETLGYLLRSAFEYRRRHMDAENELDGWLPRLFAPADLALFGSWLAGQPKPRFPLNLLHKRRR